MGGRFLKFAGDAFIVGAACYRSFKAGYHLRMGEWNEAAMQGFYFFEDISPVRARPDRISGPDVTADTQWTADPNAFMGRKSGCQVCHESVATDNWAKTTVLGQNWEMANGSPITSFGIATDQARKAWLKAGAHQ
jgi:hypothetical protein